MLRSFSCIMLLAAGILLVPLYALAQNNFVEGKAVYSIYVRSEGQPIPTKPSGSYTITIKGSMIRKDIRMTNGFSNTLIYDRAANSALSLQADKRVAIQLDPSDLRQKLRQFEGFRLVDMEGTETVSGMQGSKAKVVYKDGSSPEIIYSKQWALKEPDIFDRFPGIVYFPLAFEYRNEEGMVMSFKAEQITPGPVESALFRTPPDYKIISNEEYRKLNK